MGPDAVQMARAQLDQAEADAGQRKDELAIAQGRVAEVEGKLRTTEESLRSMEEEVQEQTYALEQKVGLACRAQRHTPASTRPPGVSPVASCLLTAGT